MSEQNMTLLVNGKIAFPEIIQCIENAKVSVEINMFIWRDDNIGNRMAEAVLVAADNGVKIILSVDRYGVVLEKSEEVKKSFFHKKQSLSEKIKINILKCLYPKNCIREKVKDEYTEIYTRIINHQNIEVRANEYKNDHSKYYIIDDEILFLGGINIEDKERDCDVNGRVYGDYMVKLYGSEYVKALRNKLNTGENSLEEMFYGINIKAPFRLFEMEQLYLEMISKAKSELYITMAYFAPIKKFVKAIIEAQRRGVHVIIIIPECANFQNDSNRRTVRKLLKKSNGQIEIYLSPKMLHTKLIMNDDYISLGSTNINPNAFSRLNELNLFVKKTNSEFEREVIDSVYNNRKESRRVFLYKDISYNCLMAFFERFVI
ncbi:MAG: phosphatidylserine/phosphatidylglycerophosphate/cardiolipin synthase family protein [Lachnospiraceae bacterium]|nr:phosphatidylserine/phosphatidylglycerophosphate/cardiolipin synthase family protein [Lachnospiraceae bacterium]